MVPKRVPNPYPSFQKESALERQKQSIEYFRWTSLKMSDKEQDEKKEKSKRQADSNESNDEEEKRSTRKKARVDYNEEKKGEASSKKETTKTEEEEEIIEDDDDDEIQDVTPTNIKSKPEETSNTTAERPTRSSSDDLMGLPMEPTGLEGAGRTSEIL